MENLQNNYIESYIDLQGLLALQVEEQCNNDFLSFVRLVAPSIVSGFKMGRHIEVISEKLQQVEDGELKRLIFQEMKMILKIGLETILKI